MAPGMGTKAAALEANTEDDLLVTVLEQYDEYLTDQEHAIELLKQAFLKLAMAKMNLPAHALGELSYKDEFEAALYVSNERDGTLAVIKESDRETNARATETLPSNNAVKRRKDTQQADQADTTTTKANPVASSSAAKNEDAAIMWFSSLPPTNLRLAQKNFRNALHALLLSAASARKIQNGVNSLSASPIAS